MCVEGGRRIIEEKEFISALLPFCRFKFTKLCSSSEGLWEAMDADIITWAPLEANP